MVKVLRTILDGIDAGKAGLSSISEVVVRLPNA